MKKTYVTSMPNHIGAFLKASRCFCELGINITRVSYNKAVDSHKLFIDAEGTEEQLKKADIELEKIGYLQDSVKGTSVVLIEFRLADVPGSVTDVLTLINDFNFNISYISSQENGSDYQYFKMGLYVEDTQKIAEFLKEAEKLCKVRVIDYNSSKKVYDNSIFYSTYVMGLTKATGLSDDIGRELLVHVNLAMQTLDENGLSPYRTFDSISKFAELLGAGKGRSFEPRISSHKITDNTEIILIEPPCGSNTMIIASRGKYLFVDSGYACYKDEMLELFHKLIPDFDSIEKTVLITHADVDHCGLLPLFDKVIAGHKTARCLENEFLGKNGYRDENPLHRPYINICKMLTSYKAVDPNKIEAMWNNNDELTEPLTQIGFFDFEELHFEVYEGKGGHLPGEIVLIDYTHHLAFTGDIYINMRGMTKEQAEYNQYAPILMTSVDTDPKLCAEERKAILGRLGVGQWQIFGAHGFKKDYSVNFQ
ncbi:MAG: MBL fold metallo-hydrolase [Clostridia bacterium]|nr:MBL fold metallo-hydrolase [Clostridia bacterium]MBR6578338.1 MBL fold metallo-hydrolase [Clostridia bacterium]